MKKYYPSFCIEELRKIRKTLSQDSQRPSRHSKLEPPARKYADHFQVLSLWLGLRWYVTHIVIKTRCLVGSDRSRWSHSLGEWSRLLRSVGSNQVFTLSFNFRSHTVPVSRTSCSVHYTKITKFRNSADASSNILSHVLVNCRRSLNWWVDLLNIHHP
jgi:hypothetical protein